MRRAQRRPASAGDAPHETVERALTLASPGVELVVIAEESSNAHLRWAENSLTTNGSVSGRAVTVIARAEGAEGTACGTVTYSGASGDELETLVRAAERAARDTGPVAEAAPLVEAEGSVSPTFTDPPLRTSAAVFDTFAPALGESFARARGEGRTLYGFATHGISTHYLATSTGLRLRHDQPSGSLTLNAKAGGGTRSAWAGVPADDFATVDIDALDADLARRLRWAERNVGLPAGRYETLLPPVAVADLLVSLHQTSDAREAAEGRTVFSAPRGGSRVGERLSRLPHTLYGDPGAPGLECCPFVLHQTPERPVRPAVSVLDNGYPLQRTEWISEGVISRLPSTRHHASRTGVAPAPAPDNLILDSGGTRSLEEMVAGTRRGLLLTSLWYIREVDPASLLLTGLTRDGVYLVEGGEITGAVNNFRFNESPMGLLARATEAGATERCVSREWGDYFPRVAMPPLRVPDFHMSSVSPGV